MRGAGGGGEDVANREKMRWCYNPAPPLQHWPPATVDSTPPSLKGIAPPSLTKTLLRAPPYRTRRDCVTPPCVMTRASRPGTGAGSQDARASFVTASFTRFAICFGKMSAGWGAGVIRDSTTPGKTTQGCLYCPAARLLPGFPANTTGGRGEARCVENCRRCVPQKAPSPHPPPPVLL